MSDAVPGKLINPFPGLRPFREEEEYLFFGRESQVDTMVDKLAQTRFLAVVGVSGSGKSSLINCGLRPALHRGLMAKAGSSWRIAACRPGKSPIRSLALALARAGLFSGDVASDGLGIEDVIEANLRMSKLGLEDVWQQARIPSGVNLLVVVDQFEELFRYRKLGGGADGAAGGSDGPGHNPEAVAFMNLLLEAKAQADYPIFIVLGMRSDFLGDCAEFAGLPEAINEGQYLVPRLTREERRAAISGPVSVGGGKISSVLLTRLVNDVGDNPDQLSILQHALNRTWDQWQREGQNKGANSPDDAMGLTHYEAVGTMAHALDRHAEEAYGELSSESQRKTCERIFKALTDKATDPRGVRRPASLQKLVDVTGASKEDVTSVIEVFRQPSRSFLMPPIPEQLTPERVIDISHESLMRWNRLKKWADEEAVSARVYRRLSETAALYANRKAGLWGDPDLQVALEWKENEKPTEAWADFYGSGFPAAMTFLEQSQAHREEEVHEREEIRRRELEQAQTLAEERQRRIEEQQEAAKRLRRWFAALAFFALLAVAALAYALGAKALAERESEAARKAENEFRLDALRIRDGKVSSQADVANLADLLIERSDDSSPQKAQWRTIKASALIGQGDYDGAEDVLTNALDAAPDYFDARTSRGYLYMLRNRPEEALEDFEYIRDRIDNKSSLNYLNLAVTYAALRNNAAADNSLQQAMANVRYGGFGEAGEVYMLPDIKAATGRTTVTVREDGFEAALRYMKANLAAYYGKTDELQKDLAEADKQSNALSSLTQEDVYFTAMNWAWILLRMACPDSGDACRDYGLLVSQAQLWERAKYPEWAGCYYGKFQEQYTRSPDKRYVSLAKWTAHVGRTRNSSCPSAGVLEDVPSLETEANEAAAGKRFPEAVGLLDKALQKASETEKIRVLARKAEVLFEAGDATYGQDSTKAFEDVKHTCDEILQNNSAKAPKAYIYRAMAQYRLDTSSKDVVLKDIERALELEPTYTEALRWLDELMPDSPKEMKEMRAYIDHYHDSLDRYYRISPFEYTAFKHRAQWAILEKRFDDAVKLIETAIAMKPDDETLKDIRAQAKRGGGKSQK